MITSYLEWLLHDAGAVEVRCIGNRTTSQIVTEADELAEIIEADKTGALFSTINRPKASALTGKALGNDDIQRRCRLFFDLDPDRPKGSPATENERRLAKAVALRVQNFLSMHGWPMPSLCCSGNGYHLHYRASLPCSEEIDAALAVIYSGLHELFSDEFVTFDRTVKNAGRVCRLYGTHNRKGIETEDRKHTITGAVIPQDWKQVSWQQVLSLAEHFRKQQEQKPVEHSRSCSDFVGGSGDYSTLDVVSWFQSLNLYEYRIAGSNKHSVVCPWESEHSTSGRNADTIIYEARDGSWPGFFCHHDHCEGRNIRDVLQALDGADSYCKRQWRVIDE